MGSDLSGQLHCVPYTTHLNTLYGRYHLSPIKTGDDERHAMLYTLFCQPQTDDGNLPVITPRT